MTDQEIAQILRELESDQARVEWLNQQAWSLSDTNQDLLLKLKMTSRAHTLAKKIDYKPGIASAACCIGLTWSKLGKSDQALPPMVEALELFRQIQDTKREAEVLMYIGMIYMANASQSETAIQWFQKALELAQSIGDLHRIAAIQLEYANLYSDLNLYDQALAGCTEAAKLFESLDLIADLHLVYGTEARIHFDLENFDKFLFFHQKHYAYFKEKNDLIQLGDSAYWLAKYHYKKRNLEETEKLFQKSIEYYSRLNDNVRILKANLRLSELYLEIDMLDMALQYAESADRAARFQNNKRYMAAAQYQFYRICEKQRSFEKALTHFKLYSEHKDDFEKSNSKENILLLQEMKKLEVAEKQREIERLRNVELAAANQKITDSIDYAQKIQLSILPDTQIITRFFTDAFVVLFPRDIVSGDFYWIEEQGDYIITALCDCTGHGVPGAFMSIVGANLLHESITATPGYDPATILQELDQRIRKALKQDGTSVQSRDGMDAGLCVFNKKAGILHFAGAGRPLFYFTEGSFVKFDGDKYSIGWSTEQQKIFRTHQIALKPKDRLYLFSDGYVDQFGGEKGRKFTPRQLQELLTSIQSLPMQAQQHICKEAFLKWRSHRVQLDDVTLIGIEWNGY